MENLIKENEEMKNKKKRKKNNFLRVIGQFAIFMLCTKIIIIGFRTVELIISLLYIISDFKIFYLLIIIAIIPFCVGYIIIECISKNHSDSYFFAIFKIYIIVFYIYDFVCYFFYFFEKINYLSPLVLLIIHDILMSPDIFIAFNEFMYCMKDN